MDKVPELLMCAQINLQNLEKVLPVVTTYVYYQIAKDQIDEMCRGLDMNESVATRRLDNLGFGV